MRAVNVIGGVAAGTLAVLGNLGAPAPAQASDFGVEINGIYRSQSNGSYARTNQVFKDERTVIETWTMSSSCVSPIECSGEVKSDGGWTAPLVYDGDMWTIDRVIPNWEPCPDGTFADGAQHFLFWSQDPVRNERNPKITTLLGGRNLTKSVSGSCGINKPLIIELPLRLEKLS